MISSGADSDSDSGSPPEDLCCPISHELMIDPVMVMATGMTYDRVTISAWLAEHDTDPSTGLELGGKKGLVPNVTLRKVIAQWLEAQQQQQRRQQVVYS
jgi:hypothetical protein